MIGTNKFADGLNPLVIGGLVTVIGMAQGGSTGYAINPARDFGPRLAHFLLPIAGKGSSNWSYAWIPIIGPLVGGAAAVGIYSLAFEHEVNTFGIAFLGIMVLAIIYAIYDESKKATQ